VDEHVTAGREQLAADGETDTLGAGGDEGAFAVESMHGETEDEFLIIIIINQLLEWQVEGLPAAISGFRRDFGR
jgi:hypothetical protein